MPGRIGRRDWFRVVAAGAAWPALARSEDGATEADAKAKAAGLSGLGRSESEHFLAVGDAPKSYRDEILGAAEAASEEFLKHFGAKGARGLALPGEKLVVVVLANASSYSRFTGEREELAVGGHYDPGRNWFVVFDYRADRGGLAKTAEAVNSLTLFHELAHLLTFNVGLLDRRSDVPRLVSEGLATYGETFRPYLKVKEETIGKVNRPRMAGLTGFGPWIPLPRLLTEDGLLEDPKTRDVAYAEAWVFTHAHLKDRARATKYFAYLAAIKGRRDPSRRLDDATAHLGDLDRLDAALRKYTRRPIGT